MKKIIFLLILVTVILGVFAVVFSFSSEPAYAQSEVGKDPGWKGIVPCGRNEGTAEETAPCTLCHFILGFQRLVQYGLYMVITLALVGIFFAGVMYVMAAGDEGMMSSAKGFMKASLIGFAVVLLGWLTVSITMWILGAKGDLGVIPSGGSWWKFSCSTKSSAGSGPAGPITTGPGAGVSISPNAIDFGQMDIGSSARENSVTLTNGSANDIKFNSATLADSAQTGFFSIGNNGCAGKTLKPKETCSISVKYNPASTGVHQDDLRVVTSALGMVVDLKGSGVAQPKPVDWYINPESGKVVISGDSVDYVVTLYDKNDKDGYIYSCSIDGKSGLRGDMESALNCRVHGTAGQKGKYSLILTATPIDPMGGGSSSTKELSVEVK